MCCHMTRQVRTMLGVLPSDKTGEDNVGCVARQVRTMLGVLPHDKTSEDTDRRPWSDSP